MSPNFSVKLYLLFFLKIFMQIFFFTLFVEVALQIPDRERLAARVLYIICFTLVISTINIGFTRNPWFRPTCSGVVTGTSMRRYSTGRGRPIFLMSFPYSSFSMKNTSGMNSTLLYLRLGWVKSSHRHLVNLQNTADYDRKCRQKNYPVQFCSA